MWKGKAAGKDTELVGYGKGTGEGERGGTLRKRAAANGRAGETIIGSQTGYSVSCHDEETEREKRAKEKHVGKQEFSRRSTIISQPKGKLKRTRSNAKICIINK